MVCQWDGEGRERRRCYLDEIARAIAHALQQNVDDSEHVEKSQGLTYGPQEKLAQLRVGGGAGDDRRRRVDDVRFGGPQRECTDNANCSRRRHALWRVDYTPSPGVSDNAHNIEDRDDSGTGGELHADIDVGRCPTAEAGLVFKGISSRIRGKAFAFAGDVQRTRRRQGPGVYYDQMDGGVGWSRSR